MFKDITKNIQNGNIEYTYLALMSHKLRVGIIGGGKAAFLKAKGFILKGCYLEILSKTFLDEFIDIESESIVLNRESYNKKFIEDKHVIVLALDDDKLRREILLHCEEAFKILIDCSDFKDGMAIVPVQRESSNISFALNTKSGNPKGAVLVAEKTMKTINKYDDFIKYTGLIRNKVRNGNHHKKEIIDFINTEDFRFMWGIDKSEIVLRLFFEEHIVKELCISSNS